MTSYGRIAVPYTPAERKDLRPKYVRSCAFEYCSRSVVRGDIFCHPDYFALPENLRHALWVFTQPQLDEAIENAKKWLSDKWHNRLVTSEEGP